MITEVQAGAYTIRGVSVGGVYTSLQIPELCAVFDVGMALRSFAGARVLFLSHAHVDHAGALTAFLGIRALVGKTAPLRVYLPAEIAPEIAAILAAWTRLQRYDLAIDAIEMAPGDERPLTADLNVRAFRTHHPVPSLGYQLVRKTKRLKPAFHGLAGPDIAHLRREGKSDLFDLHERAEIAYATDTLVEVLDHEPELAKSRILILECTFLDDKKSRKASRAGCHIHLDELIERADRFENEQLVLMHFSQIYKPHEVVAILDARCPPGLRKRIVPFVPQRDVWPG